MRTDGTRQSRGVGGGPDGGGSPAARSAQQTRQQNVNKPRPGT